MEISIKSQLICLAFSFVFGIASAVLYGLFRLAAMLFGISKDFRKGKLTSFFAAVFQFLLDIVFCFFVTVAFQILLYVFDYGRFRLIYLIAAAAGFVLYSKTLGKLFAQINEKAVYFIRKTFSAIFYYISLPVRNLFRFMAGIVSAFINLTVIKPYGKHVRRKYKKKVRSIMETKLSELVKF